MAIRSSISLVPLHWNQLNFGHHGDAITAGEHELQGRDPILAATAAVRAAERLTH
jgi:hypothetical protein